ncbi:hypothetical protein D9M69_287100 [compost metagenome]
MDAEAHVRRRIDRQRVVVAHHDRLAVAHHQQLRRQGAIEGPQALVVLHRHFRVEAYADALGRALDPVSRNLEAALVGERGIVQATRPELAAGIAVQLVAVARSVVDPRPCLHGLELTLRIELVVALVRPAPSRRPPFGGGIDDALEESAHLRGPGVAIAVVGVFGGQRVQPRMAEEGVQLHAPRGAAGDDRVLLRRIARLGQREDARIGFGIGLEGLRTELLEQQQRLGERLGAEQRARLAVGGNLEGGLRIRREDVFLQRRLAVALHPAGLHESPGVGQVRALEKDSRRVLRRVGVGRRVSGWRRPEVIQRGGGHRHGKPQQQECAGYDPGFPVFRTGGCFCPSPAFGGF